MTCRTLKHIIKDAEDLFIIRLPRARRGELVQVNEFVERHHQTLIACLPHKQR